MWISLFVNKKIQPFFIFFTIQGMFFDLNPPLPPIPSGNSTWDHGYGYFYETTFMYL